MRYLAKVSYSGENFLGFQRQPKGRTVQKEIEAQLSLLCDGETLIRAAGRTDAGVHALGQTFTFDASPIENIPAFLKALNRLLPEDIYVLGIAEVPQDFDARYSAIGKVYRYQFTVDKRDPLRTGKIAQIRRDDFKFDGFLQGLSPFIGTHSFKNFTTKPEDKFDFVRTVEDISATESEDGNLVTVFFRGSGFMRYQIRMMVGAALRVATGRMEVSAIIEALHSEKREIMPYKAPAEGLCLMEVLYATSPDL